MKLNKHLKKIIFILVVYIIYINFFKGYIIYLPTIPIYPNNEKDLPESLAIKRSNEGKPTAYICKGHSCTEPIEKFEDLIKKITESS